MRFQMNLQEKLAVVVNTIKILIQKTSIQSKHVQKQILNILKYILESIFYKVIEKIFKSKEIN